MMKLLLCLLCVVMLCGMPLGISSARDRDSLTSVIVQSPPQLLPGKLTDFTNVVPPLKGIAPISQGDTVKKVLKTYSGSFMESVRVYEIEEILLRAVQELQHYKRNLRFRVYMVDSTSGTSFNLTGGISSSSSQNGNSQSQTGMSGMGVSSSTTNPKFFIVIYDVDTEDDSLGSPSVASSLKDKEAEKFCPVGDWLSECPHCGSSKTKLLKRSFVQDSDTCNWVMKCGECGKSYEAERRRTQR